MGGGNPSHTRTKYQAFHAKGTPDGAKQDKRPLVLLAIFSLLPAVLLYRLWNLQVINGQDYADAYELKITKTVRDKNTFFLSFFLSNFFIGYFLY